MTKENREEVHAYSFIADEKEIQVLSRLMGETVFWRGDLSQFRMGKGLPDRWTDRGSIFGRNGEIRWQRIGDNFKLLITIDKTDKALDGRTPIEGNWNAEEDIVYLQDLTEPRVNPQFESYPHGERRGRLRIIAVSRNDVPLLMSPRGLLPEEGA